MHRIKVDRLELRKTLEANRAKHKKDFDSAWQGFVEFVQDQADKRVEAVKAGKVPADFSWRHAPGGIPEDHTSVYDTALEMLKWALDEDLYLEQREFEELVMDRFGWKDAFLLSTSNYIK